MAKKHDEPVVDSDLARATRRRERFDANADNESDEAHDRFVPSALPAGVVDAAADVANDLAHAEAATAVTAAGRAEALGSNPDAEAEEAERILAGGVRDRDDEEDPERP